MHTQGYTHRDTVDNMNIAFFSVKTMKTALITNKRTTVNIINPQEFPIPRVIVIDL